MNVPYELSLYAYFMHVARDLPFANLDFIRLSSSCSCVQSAAIKDHWPSTCLIRSMGIVIYSLFADTLLSCNLISFSGSQIDLSRVLGDIES